jgi:AraC family transcriptional regulator
MDRSTGRNLVESVSTYEVSAPDLIDGRMPAIDFFPADVVRHRTARWRGVHAKAMQIINHEPFEYRIKQQYHLLIAVEQGVCYDAETFIEGLPISTVRNCSHRLMFVPAGRKFFGAQCPRLLTRAICLYIDPHTVPVDPDFRFAEAELQPRFLFEDARLWETVRKLKAQIGSADPAARLYAEALGGLLSIELLRLLQVGAPPSRPSARGGLAAWQQKRVMDFVEEHLSEDVSLDVLEDLVRLSPYHFLRSFKQSFGEPPFRYWTGGGLSAPRPCWQSPAYRSTRLRMMWVSVARARSALPFIGSPGKRPLTIVATSNDARHDTRKRATTAASIGLRRTPTPG